MIDNAIGVKIYNEEEQIENSPRFRNNASPRKVLQLPNANNINITTDIGANSLHCISADDKALFLSLIRSNILFIL